MATGFDKFLSKPLPTTVKPTEHGLRTIIRRWEISAEALREANADTNAFPAYETADEEYTSALLVEQSTGDGTAFGVKLMYWRVYQELPADDATLVQLGENIVTYTDNGLKQVEQRFVARAGHVLTGTVGTSTGASGDINGLYLSGNGFAERGRVSAVVVKRWAEPGILSVSTPKVGGQQRVTVQAIGMTEAEVIAAIAEVTGNHELIDVSKGSYEGFQSLNYTFEVDAFEILSATENGLKQLTRVQLATVAFTRGAIGTDTYASLVLAGEEIDNGNTIKRRETRWAEPGVLNKSESGGPQSLPGTIRHTWEAFAVDPTDATDMGGSANTIPGIPTGRTQSNVEGIPTWRYTSIAFPVAPIDNKYLLLDYYTPRNVTRAGRVGIGLYASVPYLKIDPKSDGKEDVKVNLYVTTVKPTKVGTIAETLKGLKLGVTHLRTENRPIGSDSYTSASGNTSATTVIYRQSNSPSYKAMTGYFIDPTFGAGVSGAIYTVTYPAAIIRDGDNIVGETINGSISESYTLEGSGAADAPPAAGVYDRGIDVAFTALDGTIYYVVEEIILEVAA